MTENDLPGFSLYVIFASLRVSSCFFCIALTCNSSKGAAAKLSRIGCKAWLTFYSRNVREKILEEIRSSRML